MRRCRKTRVTSWGFGLNIFDLWQAAEKDANTIGEAQKTLGKALQAVEQKNYELASEYFVTAQKTAEEYPEIVKTWKKVVADCFRDGSIIDVLSLTRSAFGLGGAKDVLAYWQAGQEIRQIGLLVDDGRLGDVIGKIEAFCASHTGSPEMLGNVFQTVIRNAADLAASKLDKNALEKMLVTVVSHNLDVKKTIQGKIQDVEDLNKRQRRNQIEDYHQQILDSLKKQTYPDLVQANNLCGQMRLILTKDEIPEWQNLFEQVENQGKILETSIGQLKIANQARLSGNR